MKERKLRWMKLDNAAKIFPASRTRRWLNMFRLSATLTEPIDPKILQSALEKTVKRFPSIAVRLNRGIFWYYLEEIDKVTPVMEDTYYPLKKTDFSEIMRCAFRVKYYKNRIAVECFHALTDGNGGLVFLKSLVAEYIEQRYNVTLGSGRGVLDRDDEPESGELEDSFLRYEGRERGSRREENAYKIRGTHEKDGFLHLTTGIIDTEEIHRAAKKYNVSITVFIAAVMVAAINDMQTQQVPNMRHRKAVKVTIPVNLRKLFKSKSLRNFVSYTNVGINPRLGDYEFGEIVKIIYHQMGIEVTEKQMSMRFSANVKDEKSFILKVMPLFIKNAAMKMIYNIVGEKKACLSVSNLGQVELPDGMDEYITRFDFVLGAQATTPSNCGVLSYKDKLYINFTRNISEPTLERNFFTRLVKLGIHVKVESNQKS